MPDMQALRQHLRLGPSGVAGLALLLGAWIVHAGLLAPRLAQRDVLAAQVLAGPKAAGERGVRDAEAQLAAFRRTLPSPASVPQWLGRIRTAAVQNGLTVRSGDYKMERTAGSPYLRYRITFPVSGSYLQVRGFIGQVLAEVPAAAVDDVQLRREGTARGPLDARVRLTLFIAAE